MIRAALILVLAASPAVADTVVAARTIAPHQTIGAGDLLLRDVDIDGAYVDPQEIVGLEARVALYAGRPIRRGDVGSPAVIERNAIILLVYTADRLRIVTEGRALDRAAPGDMIRVLNLSSRQTVSARVGADGTAMVSP